MGLSSSGAKPICLVWHPLTLSWPLPEMLGVPCGQHLDLVHRPQLVAGVSLGEWGGGGGGGGGWQSDQTNVMLVAGAIVFH